MVSLNCFCRLLITMGPVIQDRTLVVEVRRLHWVLPARSDA